MFLFFAKSSKFGRTQKRIPISKTACIIPWRILKLCKSWFIRKICQINFVGMLLDLKETFERPNFLTSFLALFVLILSELILSVFVLILSCMCWNYLILLTDFTIDLPNLLKVAVWNTQYSFSIRNEFLDFTYFFIFGNDFEL